MAVCGAPAHHPLARHVDLERRCDWRRGTVKGLRCGGLSGQRDAAQAGGGIDSEQQCAVLGEAGGLGELDDLPATEAGAPLRPVLTIGADPQVEENLGARCERRIVGDCDRRGGSGEALWRGDEAAEAAERAEARGVSGQAQRAIGCDADKLGALHPWGGGGFFGVKRQREDDYGGQARKREHHMRRGAA